jgi:hypothetical protein
MSTDYYLLGTAILLFVAAVWSPSRKIETKAEKYKRLEEICIHGRETIMVSPARSMMDEPTP